LNAQGKAKKANLTNSQSKPNSIPTSPKSLTSNLSPNLRFHSALGNSFYKEDGLSGNSPKSATSVFSIQHFKQDFLRNQLVPSAFNERRSTTAEPKTVWLSVPQPKRGRELGQPAGNL